MFRVEKARIKFQNVLCHYMPRVYSQIWVKQSSPDYCPICNSKLQLNDIFYRTINNSFLFPNCLVHEKCITQSSSVEGLTWLDFYTATQTIYENYQVYKQLFNAWK